LILVVDVVLKKHQHQLNVGKNVPYLH